MSAAAAPTSILYRPTTIGNSRHAHLPRLNSPKTVSGLQFPSSKLISSVEFNVPQKPASQYKRRAWGRNTMTESTSISALGGSIGDEDVGALEQDSFINGSSEFRPSSRPHGGLEATLNRLSKWLVAALFGAVLLLRHDAKALWAAMGSVINIGLSTILKRVLNQERPVSNLRSDPGMPSSHAQAIFFSIIFFVVSMFQWLGVNGLTLTLSGLPLAFASYLSWLRVSQQLHTISQVVVGAMVGSAFSILWFWSWDAIVLNAFITYLWVRIIVVLGATISCVGFLIHVVQHWVIDR